MIRYELTIPVVLLKQQSLAKNTVSAFADTVFFMVRWDSNHHRTPRRGVHRPVAQASFSCRFAAIHLLQTPVDTMISFRHPPQGEKKCKRIPPSPPLKGSLKRLPFSMRSYPRYCPSTTCRITQVFLLRFINTFKMIDDIGLKTEK